jgi:hypothetical protein
MAGKPSGPAAACDFNFNKIFSIAKGEKSTLLLLYASVEGLSTGTTILTINFVFHYYFVVFIVFH